MRIRCIEGGSPYHFARMAADRSTCAFHPHVQRARRTTALTATALLSLLGCAREPTWITPTSGGALTGEEVLLRMRWLAQPDRLRDADAMLRVTGGRFALRPPNMARLGILPIDDAVMPGPRSGVTYLVPSADRIGPTRNSYSLSVELDERHVCITPAEMERLLGRFEDVGPPPIGVRGDLRREQPITSAIYRYRSGQQWPAEVIVTFTYQHCANRVSVGQVAS